MKPHILFLQMRSNKEIIKQENRCVSKFSEDIVIKNIFEEPVTKEDILAADKIMIGGSGDFSFSLEEKLKVEAEKIKNTMPLVQVAIDKGIPVLGICLGHQYLAYMLGSKIIHDEAQKEIGAFSIHLTEEGKSDVLFKDLPETFLAQQGHGDSVSVLPENTVLLATGERCKIQSFRLKDKKVYGVQFHPELTKEDSEERMRILGIEEDISFSESPLAELVIRNFISL